jgi:DNA-binding NarL/FixJ family response regulator
MEEMDPQRGRSGATDGRAKGAMEIDGATKTVSVLIVDDQLPFRAVARTVIGMTAGFEVAGEAASAEDALACVDANPPDLVLMDINLPGMNGIEATRHINDTHPGTAVILLSTYSEADLPATAHECGALAYVHKEDFGPALVRQLWDGRSST